MSRLEAADAAVHVEGHAALRGEGADAGHGIDHAVRVLRGRGGDEDGVAVDEAAHGRDVGAVIGAEVGVAEAQAEVVGGLVEGHVDAARGDDSGLRIQGLRARARLPRSSVPKLRPPFSPQDLSYSPWRSVASVRFPNLRQTHQGKADRPLASSAYCGRKGG